MPSALDKLAFNTAQAARVSWFFGQKLLASRMGRPVPMPEAVRGRPIPDRRRLLTDLRDLIEQDWRNIEAGYYVPPAEGRLAAHELQELRRRAAPRPEPAHHAAKGVTQLRQLLVVSYHRVTIIGSEERR